MKMTEQFIELNMLATLKILAAQLSLIEKRSNKQQLVALRFFDDGSGEISSEDGDLFEFENFESLLRYVKYINHLESLEGEN